jgi:C1A family cysteine protease
MKNYHLGWIPDVPDQRDVPFAKTFRLPSALPSVVDLRAECSPVEDQGSLGSCTAQALVGALEFLEIKAGTPFQNLSRLFVYYNELFAEGNKGVDAGAQLRTGIKVLKSFGVCREDKWPYDISKFSIPPTVECDRQALDHQVTAYQRLTTLTEMKACLAMGLPFVFGWKVFKSAMSDKIKASGDVPMPSRWEKIVGPLGGHAEMMIGYDDSKGKWLPRNSWGADWGDDGYGTLPYDYPLMDCWTIQSTENDLYAMHKINDEEAVV